MMDALIDKLTDLFFFARDAAIILTSFFVQVGIVVFCFAMIEKIGVKLHEAKKAKQKRRYYKLKMLSWLLMLVGVVMGLNVLYWMYGDR